MTQRRSRANKGLNIFPLFGHVVGRPLKNLLECWVEVAALPRQTVKTR